MDIGDCTRYKFSDFLTSYEKKAEIFSTLFILLSIIFGRCSYKDNSGIFFLV